MASLPRLAQQNHGDVQRSSPTIITIVGSFYTISLHRFPTRILVLYIKCEVTLQYVLYTCIHLAHRVLSRPEQVTQAAPPNPCVNSVMLVSRMVRTMSTPCEIHARRIRTLAMRYALQVVDFPRSSLGIHEWLACFRLQRDGESGHQVARSEEASNSKHRRCQESEAVDGQPRLQMCLPSIVKRPVLEA